MSSHRWPSLLALLAACALAGCASPDDPTPRRPIIPQPVQDLTARQQGNAVVLSFTLPSQSTRKEPLPEPPAIEIYRGVVRAGGKPPEKTSMQFIYTIPGEMAASYLEDGRIVFRYEELARGGVEGRPLVLLPRYPTTYVVRTRAERNRASNESNRVLLRIQLPPEPVAEVKAAIVDGSVMLDWSSVPLVSGDDEGYRVYRAEIAPESAAAAREDVAKAAVLAPLRLLGQVAETRYRDSNFEWGHTYMYVVRRAAQFGAETVESADSKPAVVTPAEVSPPATPQGVEAVVVPATAQAAAYVSLSWAISAEAGVAGYAVYRSEQAEAPGVKLNESLLGAPTYRDVSVTPGRRYFYWVAAVDGAGQESAPSAAAEAQIPEQQP